jgi:hypothetical protein
VSGVDFSGRSVKGEVNCSFTYANLNKAIKKKNNPAKGGALFHHQFTMKLFIVSII